MDAQWKKLNPLTDFRQNPFAYFNNAPILLVGTQTQSNAMTIGWGLAGTLWNQPTLTVFVAPARYTFDFMQSAPYFMVMDFENPEIARYLGSHSGRDEDKAQALHLTTRYTENRTPFYEEATRLIECQTMYAAPFLPENFKHPIPKEYYAHSRSGFHSFYVGAICNIWEK